MRDDAGCDVTKSDAMLSRLERVDGVIWLAAISSIKTAEAKPDLCQAVNVTAVEEFFQLTAKMRNRPWLVFISSREVYGEQDTFPVAETASFRPKNVYARSKVAGEKIVAAQRENLPAANIIRLSNIYGFEESDGDLISSLAMAGTSARPATWRIEDVSLDFTHIDDVIRGIAAISEKTHQRQNLPDLHLVSGVSTSIEYLRTLVEFQLDVEIEVVATASQAFEVRKFQGDPSLAERTLGWRTRTVIEDGVRRLVDRLQHS